MKTSLELLKTSQNEKPSGRMRFSAPMKYVICVPAGTVVRDCVCDAERDQAVITRCVQVVLLYPGPTFYRNPHLPDRTLFQVP